MLIGGDDISNYPWHVFFVYIRARPSFSRPAARAPRELAGRLGVMAYFSRGFASIF